MVTVVKNPLGHKIIDQAIEASITNSGGDALITLVYHGLGTGDFVYITSDIDEYNGFWYVTSISTNTFKISEHSGADFVEHYQDADITYYQTNDHYWNSVFLPIVYKVSTDLWPINSVDPVRALTAIGNDNGYLEIFTSGSLKGGIQALDYVKITGAGSEELNGVWQIVEVISATNFVLDAAHTAGSISGASVQFYYNNYQVKVKVYAGLPPSHPWQAKKPYEEVAELSLTPDENNLVMFSVSDYIKGKTAIKNNPTLYSMPLNLDAFTGYYVAVAEDYDTSDGYSLTTNEGAFTDDTFQGYAVTGKLPFKNVYAGDYADYIYTDGSPAHWLTALDRLLAVEDKYFDISFIKNVVGNFTVYIDKYIADYLSATETVAYIDQGIGVYRIPIEANAGYDSFCVRIVRDEITSGFTPEVMDAIDTWTNLDTGDVDWILAGSIPGADTDSLGLGVTSDKWHTDYGFEAGQLYSFAYEFDAGIGSKTFHIDIVDVGGVTLDDQTHAGSGVLTGSFTFYAPTGAAGINIWFHQSASCGSPSGGCIGSIESFTNETDSTPGGSPAVTITEEICIDILESCDAASGFTPTDIRLLEDGSYRILE